MTEGNILEIKNLIVEYVTDEAIVHAVNGVNLTVKKGETIGLVGETGAGKTTIAKSIMRIPSYKMTVRIDIAFTSTVLICG